MNRKGIVDAPVLLERYRQMMTIVLNRPEALNSLSIEMIRLTLEAMNEAGASRGSQRGLSQLWYSRSNCCVKMKADP
ncbi:MAG: hypothetical protein JRJ29_23085 [Deltaproteobacteria bacterium]|nr:hypothetical protein [Deltaproteobacteria bacterium]